MPGYEKITIGTPDDDFLELFLLQNDQPQLVILSHGLEGNAHRSYMSGMAEACFESGFDVISWNFRGCGETLNHQRRFYHSGATEDLDLVIQWAQCKGYKQVNLIGFSLGGNLTLKYLGERGANAPIHRAIAFSVPLDLHASCLQLAQPMNRLYAQRFLKSLKKKIYAKAQVRNDISLAKITQIKTLLEFDDHYTAPFHGFENALHYYTTCSSLHYLEHITIPTLVVNALNDPIVSRECYSHSSLQTNPSLTFLPVPRGGHVGFTQFGQNGRFWSESLALKFLTESLT